ncbi:MAG: cobyrinate a,c-diamide synthase [Shimia sp.]
MRAVMIAAPSSSSGKTVITMSLLAALRRAGHEVTAIKLGPDYIDPGFHAAASGRPCLNLDPWSMSANEQAARLPSDGTLIVEAAMGLFDGAGIEGRGSAADVAKRFDLPVVLVIDCARAAHSIGALVHGFVAHDPRVRFAGLILNRVGSVRHAAMLRHTLADAPPVLGVIPRHDAFAHPSRHLGLVQAGERDDLADWLRSAAATLSSHMPCKDTVHAWCPPASDWTPPPPPAQRIAVARDEAFAFAYPHLLRDWQAAGAEVRPFSPLADEAVPDADFVFLPGGYPELHAGRLAHNSVFMRSLRNAAQSSVIYGECGGYMVLGDTLKDADGTTHAMAGLLRLETSFATRKLHLGYRAAETPFPGIEGGWRGHEFHHSVEVSARGQPLFTHVKDADDTPMADYGLREGRVGGSYLHLISRAGGRC